MLTEADQVKCDLLGIEVRKSSDARGMYYIWREKWGNYASDIPRKHPVYSIPEYYYDSPAQAFEALCNPEKYNGRWSKL